MLSLPLALLLVRSATDRFVQGLFDDTFTGIHKLGVVRLGMLIPYFTVLGILSIYGLHRYDIIRTYFKHRKNATTEPPGVFDHLPPVTIQLPLYNETLRGGAPDRRSRQDRIPKELLQIQVLDDSTDDTAPFAEALVERYRALGCPIEIPPPRAPPRLQGGGPPGGAGNGDRRVRGHFDADFWPAIRLPHAHQIHLLRRSGWWGWCRRAGAI